MGNARIVAASLALLVVAWSLPGGASAAGGRGTIGLAAGDFGGQGANIDLSVRQVTVTPIRAHVGDTVRVEVVVENRDEGRDTTRAVVYANGREVARQLFTWGMSPGDRIHRLSFEWNTAGAAPGEYAIRGEAFVWADSSPFDNHLDVKERLLLAPPGGEFPGGAKAGGSATETDPRFPGSRPGG